jgi:hypothetical protein
VSLDSSLSSFSSSSSSLSLRPPPLIICIHLPLGFRLSLLESKLIIGRTSSKSSMSSFYHPHPIDPASILIKVMSSRPPVLGKPSVGSGLLPESGLRQLLTELGQSPRPESTPHPPSLGTCPRYARTLGRSTLADIQDMHLSEGYYEIIGTVKEDKSVKALTSIELGPSLG